MSHLGDYLGQFMTEITNARVHADLESVRLAELYASHPLLKYMPVPHFRLPTVTLDIPIIIKEMEPRKKETQTQDQVLEEMKIRFNEFLIPYLKNTGIKLEKKTIEKIDLALKKKSVSLKPTPKLPLSTTHITDEFVNSVIQTLRESHTQKEIILEEGRLDQLAEELKHSSYVDLSNFIQSPPRLDVLVTTAELREAGPSDRLTYVHLTVSESGVEWTTVESKGKTQSRLVPE